MEIDGSDKQDLVRHFTDYIVGRNAVHEALRSGRAIDYKRAAFRINQCFTFQVP